MPGIKDRVAILGMGCTKFGERWDAGAADLMVEAGYEAYEDAGVDPKDIQAAWLGTVQTFRTGQPLAQALKAGLHSNNPCGERVCNRYRRLQERLLRRGGGDLRHGPGSRCGETQRTRVSRGLAIA